ncbi:MAG: RHS repeat-associated core domain-containing protein, partial [Chryseobacterium sp.]|nr:RHS repeat-associated core domain-containing protein [Chryseobacterium sp.]
MTQDANMGVEKKWLFTKYDQFGRVAYTGIYTSSQDYGSIGRNYEQGQVNGKGSNNVERTSSGFAQPGVLVYYDNLTANNYPNTITKLLSVNYYDTYPTDTPNLSTLNFGQTFISDTATNSINTKGLPTASYINNVETNGWTKGYSYYDGKGRAIATYSRNHLGGYTQTESYLDFAGVVQKTETRHKRKSADVELVVREEFGYDHQNRLLTHTHEVVGKTPKELLVENHYNEIGQLDWKKVGGVSGSYLQKVDLSYNIRGWMTGINSADIAYSPSDESHVLNNGKLFGYNIRYNDPNNPSLGTAKYNGNIAEIDWIYKDNPLKRYGYQYDRLNRLLKGNYQDPGSTVPETHINDEALTYDLNGNIKTLVRNSKHGKYYTPVVIDNLGYQYVGNRVTNITDASGNSSGYEGGGQTMTYDANGNTTAMPDKNISAIAYNFLNLPKQIDQNANVTNYYYRADGVKVKKRFVLTNSSGTKTINTEYLDGFQYSTPNTDPLRKALEEPDDATMAASTAGEEEAFAPDLEREVVAVVDPGTPEVENMVLSFFPTSEGYYDYENFRYIYQYKDHLGNVRVSYVKNGNDLEIRDRNDYYPFGMSFLKPFGQVSLYDPMAIPYNYKYNGKELQETGMYDYGARMYMSDIGRWGTIDPLAEQTRRWSP